jgi:regulator of sirC expression with transglutaminase-like and TPR domain
MIRTFEGDPEFQKLTRDRHDADLVGFLLEVARDRYPNLDVDGCLQRIDDLGNEVKDRLAGELDDESLAGQLACFSKYLFVEEGFTGDKENYDDPRNSYLNEVVSRRRGIPITLGILHMSVAGVAGLPIYGVCAPSHFLTAIQDDDDVWYIDPFHRGRIMRPDECTAFLAKSSGLTPEQVAEQLGPARPLAIAARVLRNLKASFAKREDWPAVLTVQERLFRMLPKRAEETRDLGLVHLRLGRAAEAVTELESFLKVCSPASAKEVAPYLQSARKLASEMN